MQVKDILRRSNFEYYRLQFEGDAKTYLVDKDLAFKRFALMYVTEIDYTTINSGSNVVALNLLVVDKDKVFV